MPAVRCASERNFGRPNYRKTPSLFRRRGGLRWRHSEAKRLVCPRYDDHFQHRANVMLAEASSSMSTMDAEKFPWPGP